MKYSPGPPPGPLSTGAAAAERVQESDGWEQHRSRRSSGEEKMPTLEEANARKMQIEESMVWKGGKRKVGRPEDEELIEGFF